MYIRPVNDNKVSRLKLNFVLNSHLGSSLFKVNLLKNEMLKVRDVHGRDRTWSNLTRNVRTCSNLF